MVKRNITVTLDEETARWVRIEAAKRDESVSSYLADLLRQERERTESYALAMALYLDRIPRALGPEGASLPTREEIHRR
jgi:hypothetical protein